MNEEGRRERTMAALALRVSSLTRAAAAMEGCGGSEGICCV